MKIGLVCPYNIFGGGGVQECVLALQSELKARGHEALVITPKHRNYEGKNKRGILLVGASTDVKSPFHTTAQVSATVDTQQLKSLLDAHEFDVLHFHEPWVPLLSWQILTHSSSVNVATFHAKLPETLMSKTIEKVITPYTKTILKSLDTLTAVSDAASEYVSALSTRSPVIVPNGIDIEKYQPAKSAKVKKTRTILYVGRLEKRKGVKYLLAAFKILAEKYPDLKLIIAGDGTDRLKLEAFVRDKQVPRVTFKGFVSEKTKIKLMQEAAVFCSPAIYGESFGIVLLEAMAAGTVVVAANNPGYSAVLKDRGAISIVNPKAIGVLASRIEVFLNDQELCAMWQAWAADYVKNFSYKKITDLYENEYKRAIAAR